VQAAEDDGHIGWGADRARDDLVGFPRFVPLDYQFQINIQLHQALCTVVQSAAPTPVRSRPPLSCTIFPRPTAPI
jgi:hypothetical protein